MIKELIEYIVQQLVDKPELVQVSVVQDGPRETYQISVDFSDRGKVIGRQGQTIKAIRTMAHVFASQDKKITVDIL